MALITPDPSRPIVKSMGTMEDTFRRWTLDVSRLELIIGTGSPEGTIEAAQGREYMDEAGTSGAIKYIKRDSDIAGDRSMGWILI